MAKKPAVQPADIPEVQPAPPPPAMQAEDKPWPAPLPELGILIWEIVAEVPIQGQLVQHSICGIAPTHEDATEGAIKTFRRAFGPVPFVIVKTARLLKPAFIHVPQKDVPQKA